MDRRRRKRILLAQNFLKDAWLVETLVRKGSICGSDVVYEIGPGSGIITAELSKRARRVVAIERDPSLAGKLRRRFFARDNVAIVEYDFLKYRIPEKACFKIFGNVPFCITAQLMRKLLYEKPIATEIFLVLQKEAAWKYSGARGETLVSLFAKPRFSFEIVHRFRRTDFVPAPNADSVLLKIVRRARPAIARSDEPLYRAFVSQGFSRWRPSLRLAFNREFSYKQWKRLARELGFQLNAKPSELSFEQWLALFSDFMSRRDV